MLMYYSLLPDQSWFLTVNSLPVVWLVCALKKSICCHGWENCSPTAQLVREEVTGSEREAASPPSHTVHCGGPVTQTVHHSYIQPVQYLGDGLIPW